MRSGPARLSGGRSESDGPEQSDERERWKQEGGWDSECLCLGVRIGVRGGGCLCIFRA